MNCQETIRQRDDYLDAHLEAAAQKRVADHLAGCQRCREAYASEEALRATLRALPVEAPSADFYERIFEQTAARYQRTRQLRFGVGIGGALAAGFALLLIGSSMFGTLQQSKGSAELPGLTISLNTVSNVKLVFDSTQALASASFTVVLPPGVELKGFPDQREITWQGKLKKGKNLLVLPLIARNTGSGELAAYIRHDGKEKAFRLQMRVNDRKTSALPYIQKTPLA